MVRKDVVRPWRDGLEADGIRTGTPDARGVFFPKGGGPVSSSCYQDSFEGRLV